MSLFKRGSIWWSYFRRDGIRYQESTGTSNRRQAETIEADLKMKVANQRFQIVEVDPEMTFSQLAARFVDSAAVRPYHPSRLKMLLPFFADLPVVRLTKATADEFRRQRQSQGAIKDATVNRDLETLRHILYWAVDQRMLQSNPLRRLRMPRERRLKRQVLSVAEEELLLGAAFPHVRNIIMAALDTGMRRGEITSQRWEDVDLSQRVLFVTRSKTPQGESREIPLTQRLFNLLRNKRKGEGATFDHLGRKLHYFKGGWRKSLKASGIRHIRFHDLRHTFNTRLMEAGVMQETRMALMGHAPGAKVHAMYTHIELPAKREAIRKLEEWRIRQEQLLKNGNRASSETGGINTGFQAETSGGPRRPSTNS